MHEQAMSWIKENGSGAPLSVLDIGGRNINGTARSAWPNAGSYVVLDILPGDGVDIVADASTWTPDRQYDVVVCAEVFEHTACWREIVSTVFVACSPGGTAVFTMAGPGRAPHSAIDGAPIRDYEYYGNVDPHDLHDALKNSGFVDIVVDQKFNPCDVRAVARKL